MTFGLLQKVIEEHNIPSDVHLTSDSGWECDATEMNGVYYNKSKNEIVFTQYPYDFGHYYESDDWELLYGDVRRYDLNKKEEIKMSEKRVSNFTVERCL